MKQPAAGDTNSMIRVDSPTDVSFLTGAERIARNAVWNFPIPRVPYMGDSPTRLKAIGTDYFKAKMFIPAARTWTLAIQKAATSPELYLNRAQAYISLEWYSAALRDAVTVLELELDTLSNFAPKAAFRAARAEYGLGRYDDALSRFRTVGNSAARDWEDKCRRRTAEVERGEYNWVEVFSSGQRAVPTLDVASHIGPISVQAIPGRGGGRGVVGTRDLKTGDLLVRHSLSRLFRIYLHLPFFS